MTRIVDVRLVLDRADVLHVYVEGRRVDLDLATNDASAILAALARRVDGAAWSRATSTIEALATFGREDARRRAA